MILSLLVGPHRDAYTSTLQAAMDEYADCFIDAEKLPEAEIRSALAVVTGSLGLSFPRTAEAMRRAVKVAKDAGVTVRSRYPPLHKLFDCTNRPVEIRTPFLHQHSYGLGIFSSRQAESGHELTCSNPNAADLTIHDLTCVLLLPHVADSICLCYTAQVCNCSQSPRSFASSGACECKQWVIHDRCWWTSTGGRCSSRTRMRRRE